ncbi:MAG: hypothetical protein KatS3mg109_0739 [Pirellulaceae bacterium]|nr:MAG: hypothetical protein KatS3mg109_0739 [Pirellulaceae bacterium]GIW92673.1 MAG: hypothetical protein KatS3mg110_0714 [Pirellulaceae bacterium]
MRSRWLAIFFFTVLGIEWVLCNAGIYHDVTAWRPADPNWVNGQAVGEWEYYRCCTKGAKLACEDQSPFSCTGGTVFCREGFYIADSCSSANCSQPADATNRCDIETLVTLRLKRCIATGIGTGDGCDPGMTRCLYRTEQWLVRVPGVCMTGSSLCPPALQPANPCQ